MSALADPFLSSGCSLPSIFGRFDKREGSTGSDPSSIIDQPKAKAEATSLVSPKFLRGILLFEVPSIVWKRRCIFKTVPNELLTSFNVLQPIHHPLLAPNTTWSVKLGWRSREPQAWPFRLLVRLSHPSGMKQLPSQSSSLQKVSLTSYLTASLYGSSFFRFGGMLVLVLVRPLLVAKR